MTPLEKAESLLPEGYTLLYLTEFGSHLYGTNSSDSDRDYKGIYLPSLSDTLLGKVKNSIVSSTGTANSKNTNTDIDIGLYSIQHFMSKMYSGEINAIDILFSGFSKSVIYIHPKYKESVLCSYQSLLSKNTKAYTGYCMQQASKYGIKGSRYGDLKKFLNYIKPLDKTLLIKDILDQLPELTYVSLVKNKDEDYLQVLGKLHPIYLPISELYNRISIEIDKYGERSKVSTGGVDWKALSHAYRACIQVLELVETKFITFPLTKAEEVLTIKYPTKDTSLEKILESIADKLQELKIKTEKSDLPKQVNPSIIDNIILSFY